MEEVDEECLGCKEYERNVTAERRSGAAFLWYRNMQLNMWAHFSIFLEIMGPQFLSAGLTVLIMLIET
jgi:hypothetical protein